MNRKELTQMITLYGDAIYAYCYRVTNNKNEADELYQDTFLKALEICHKIDGSNNPKCYLIGIANRVWKNKQKKCANRNRLVVMQHITEEVEGVAMVSGEMYTPENSLLKSECKDIILESLTLLNDKIRIPIIMYYVSELTVKEIAKVLKIPEGTVKTRLHKGRELLRKELKERNYEA